MLGDLILFECWDNLNNVVVLDCNLRFALNNLGILKKLTSDNILILLSLLKSAKSSAIFC